MEDIKKQSEIVRQRLEYHFRTTDGSWNIEGMNAPFMKEFLNEVERLCALSNFSNRFSPEQMAEWFHNNYEKIAKAEGWQTQDKCKVEFTDLPEENKITMIKVCQRWLNGS